MKKAKLAASRAVGCSPRSTGTARDILQNLPGDMKAVALILAPQFPPMGLQAWNRQQVTL